MTPATDTFGSWGRSGPPAPMRAARALDRLVTGAIALALALTVALAGYSLWDSWNVVNGGTQLSRPTDAESFAALRAQNPDVVAWLTVDGTAIDYPVVQGEDDFEYLTKDATGQYAASGSIFLDAACDPEFREPYELIMGHHMQYSKMFGDLDKFLDQQFFDENRSATLMLPDRTLSLEVVAVLQADAYEATIYGLPAGADRMEAIVSYVSEHAQLQRSGEFSASDQLIALSTCASSGANERTVVVCKVVGEQPADGS